MSREYTEHLIGMALEGAISWEALARECLCYMSEDDVQDMAQSTFDVDLEEEEPPSYMYDDEEEVREAFDEEWEEACNSSPRLKKDIPAKREAFCLFVDRLARAGDISDDLASSATLED